MALGPDVPLMTVFPKASSLQNELQSSTLAKSLSWVKHAGGGVMSPIGD